MATSSFLLIFNITPYIALKLMNFENVVTALGGFRFIIKKTAHGTAFDIAGKGIANPIAQILSAAMIGYLHKLGRDIVAAPIETEEESHE